MPRISWSSRTQSWTTFFPSEIGSKSSRNAERNDAALPEGEQRFARSVMLGVENDNNRELQGPRAEAGQRRQGVRTSTTTRRRRCHTQRRRGDRQRHLRDYVPLRA